MISVVGWVRRLHKPYAICRVCAIDEPTIAKKIIDERLDNTLHWRTHHYQIGRNVILQTISRMAI